MLENFRHGALWLILFNYATYTTGQDNNVTLNNLPSCAKTCAESAALYILCDTGDTTCLCSHQQFPTDTNECANVLCSIDDADLTEAVLNEMCFNGGSSTTSLTPDLTSSTTGKSTATASTSTISTQAQLTSTSPSTTDVPPTTTSSPSTTQSASSTVVVVQTVVVQPSTTLISAAGRLDTRSVFMSTVAPGTFIFGLPSLIWLVAAI